MADVGVMDISTVGRSGLSISRTDIDSYANIFVVLRNEHITSEISMIAEVSPFILDYDKMLHYHVVDATIIHDNEYAGDICMLIFKDALSVLCMDHKLVLLFIMRDAGINLRTTLKFQREDPAIDDHSVCFPKDNLGILLKLYGMLSCFT